MKNWLSGNKLTHMVTDEKQPRRERQDRALLRGLKFITRSSPTWQKQRILLYLKDDNNCHYNERD